MALDRPTFTGEREVSLRAAALTSSGCTGAALAIDDDPATAAVFAAVPSPAGRFLRVDWGVDRFITRVRLNLSGPGAAGAGLDFESSLGFIEYGPPPPEVPLPYVPLPMDGTTHDLTLSPPVIARGVVFYPDALTTAAAAPTPVVALFHDGPTNTFRAAPALNDGSAATTTTIGPHGVSGYADDDWLILDLGGAQAVTGVALANVTASRSGLAVAAYVTNDYTVVPGTTGTTLLGATACGAAGSALTIAGGPATGRYVQALIQSGAAGDTVAVGEAQAFGPAGTFPLTAPTASTLVSLAQLQVYEATRPDFGWATDTGELIMPQSGPNPTRRPARVGCSGIALFPRVPGAAYPFSAALGTILEGIQMLDFSSASKEARITGGETVHQLDAFETDREIKGKFTVEKTDYRAMQLFLSGQLTVNPANANGPEVQYFAPNYGDRALYVSVVALSVNGDPSEINIFPKVKLSGNLTRNFDRDNPTKVEIDFLLLWDTQYPRQDGAIGGIYEQLFSDGGALAQHS